MSGLKLEIHDLLITNPHDQTRILMDHLKSTHGFCQQRLEDKQDKQAALFEET